jgi:excisionase family DNA binding protein
MAKAHPPEVKAERRTYTIEEAAEMLGISRATAYEAVKRGQLPALRLGRRRFVISAAALNRLLAA